jgi:hypothetical protein
MRKGDVSLRQAYRTVQVQAMQHSKHIEARDRAFCVGVKLKIASELGEIAELVIERRLPAAS